MSQLSYTTPHGITVTRKTARIPFARGLQKLLTQLDTKRGVYFSSGYEYPERYSRWDFASVAPSIEIVCQGRRFEIRALNRRGRVIIQLLARVLRSHPHWDSFEESESALLGQLKPLPAVFPEEERSKQPSPFSILRALVRRIPESGRLAPRPHRRLRLRPASPVRSHPPAPAAREPKGHSPLPLRRHLLHGSQEGSH